MIQITLEDFVGALGQKQTIAKRTLPIKGSLDSQVETQVQIHRHKNEVSEKMFQFATIKGQIKVALMPKFQQSGDTFLITKDHLYLVVKLTKLDVQEAVNGLGDPYYWVTLEWGGVIRQSKRTNRAETQDLLYFKLGLTEQQLKGDKSDLTDSIMEELRTKPEIQLTVWAEANKQIIFIGISRVQIREIASDRVSFADRSFVDQVTREKVTFQTRVLYETVQLASAFSDKSGSVEL